MLLELVCLIEENTPHESDVDLARSTTILHITPSHKRGKVGSRKATNFVGADKSTGREVLLDESDVRRQLAQYKVAQQVSSHPDVHTNINSNANATISI